ncbi:class I adenylate-forming enzyme family protein, partial [Candidatus Dependentiae bacterium]
MKKILEEIFLSNWNKDFLIDGISGERLSYKKFWDIVLNCKFFLTDLGLKKGDKICLLMENSIDFIAIYFASLLINLRVVPIDPLKGKHEIKSMLKAYDLKNIFSNIDDCCKVFNAININDKKKCFYTNVSNNKTSLKFLNKIDFDLPYLVSFTTGSTGISKGVIHSFNNLCKSALAFNEFFRFNCNNIFYHNLPMSYMAGILNLVILPLLAGSKIVIGPRFNFSRIMNFWDIPIKYLVNTFWFVPTELSLLLSLDRGVQGVEYCKNKKIIGCVGTAPLPKETKINCEDRYGIKLYESYGLSETLFVSTNSPLDGDRIDSVGKVLRGIDLSISEKSEIIIFADWVFLGYLNKPSSKKFKTGDLGFIDRDGFLHITDRIKNLVIKGGVNISPIKLETYIRNFNFFRELVVVGLPDKILGEKLACFCVPEKNIDLVFKKIINSKINSDLGADYKIDEFIEIAKIPKNINGKIDRVLLKVEYNLVQFLKFELNLY